MYKKALLAVTILLFLFFSVNLVFSAGDFFKGLAMINDVHTMVKEHYVEPGDVRDQDMAYRAIKGMLEGLDPHTAFFDPEESRDMITDIEGSFGGLGIRIDKKGDFVVVVSPIEGTPAYRMGIQAGDRIVEVDGESAVGLSLEKVISMLRGDIGTKVRVSIQRDGVADLLTFEIVREKIELPSLAGTFMIDETTGYIRFIHFQENSLEEMKKALAGLKAEGMEKLILDLRYNPGGILEIAHGIADLFIPRGEVIVSTRGRDGILLEEYRSTDPTPYADISLALLVDRGSASASEILAGAVKDLKRGLIIGEKTYGKGSVQRIYSLRDGSALKMTIAYYYTPGGTCVDGTGIEPDITVESRPLPVQLVDLLRGNHIEDFTAKRTDITAEAGDETILSSFRENLEKEGYDFKEHFIGDGVNAALITEYVPDWKGKIFDAIAEELIRQIRYRLIYRDSGEEAARLYLAGDDPVIEKAREALSEKGGR
ncbi:MAG TPA: S41 family peptidase [Candidatus Mcinerneyibacteriales bacterium]|nr:S41 family peptidase [Candidatus Mcinerneyibacteriales bacterium]HPQ89363.1 S41 family peptidase [Candidatus Mcinerneyibacteriales bacterium]